MHSPSLHTIDGEQFELEMDIVHTLVKGEQNHNQLAVVSLLFESTSEETPFFEKFNPKERDQFEFTLKELVKDNLDVFYY